MGSNLSAPENRAGGFGLRSEFGAFARPDGDSSMSRQQHDHRQKYFRRYETCVYPSNDTGEMSQLRGTFGTLIDLPAAIGRKFSCRPRNGGDQNRQHMEKQSSSTAGIQPMPQSLFNRKMSRLKFRDHCRLFRKLINDWPLKDLHCLIVELETSAALWELQHHADAARPSAASVYEDFACMEDQLDCLTDVCLHVDDEHFPVNRAFLSKRCSFFKRLFDDADELLERDVDADRLPTILVPMLNKQQLKMLIHYAYTDQPAQSVADFIVQSPFNSLTDDLESMLQLAETVEGEADLLLIFSADATVPDTTVALGQRHSTGERRSKTSLEEQEKRERHRFKCHKVVLAARSKFFRSALRRRHDNSQQTTCGKLSEIIIDDAVIPARYALVLLTALYTDKVDLSLIMHNCTSNASSSLDEVQAIALGRHQLSLVDEAMEIYQIGRFLEVDKLVQGCEDAIVEQISLDTLVPIYNWSTEAHGSAFVRRRCVDYLCKEFSRVCSSPVLFELTNEFLTEALPSDFVQASELEILEAVIRWGEHEAIRINELREPNLLAGVPHSIRKGIKRADVSDADLRNALAGLMPFVRSQFVLPPDHPILHEALNRQLLSISVDCGRSAGTSPSHHHQCPLETSGSVRRTMSSLSAVCVMSNADTSNYCSTRQTTGPRFLKFYLNEARQLLEKRLKSVPEQLPVLINYHPPIPHSRRLPNATDYSRFASSMESIIGRATFEKLNDRINQLLQSGVSIKRAMACGCQYHRRAVWKQVRLRALRELGLSESLLAMEENDACSALFLTPSTSSSVTTSPSRCHNHHTLPSKWSQQCRFNNALFHRTKSNQGSCCCTNEIHKCSDSLSHSMNLPDIMTGLQLTSTGGRVV